MDETYGGFSGDSVVVTGIGTSMAASLWSHLNGKSSIDAADQLAHDAKILLITYANGKR